MKTEQEWLTNSEIIEWLLEDSNPSVKYWTLKDLLEKNEVYPQVIETRENIMASDCVLSLLCSQIENKYWEKPNDMYNPKYRATTHSLLILAELGAKPILRIQNALEYIFRFQRDTGHFWMDLPKTAKGKASTLTDGCCIDGNILTYLALFGYQNSDTVTRLLNFLSTSYDWQNTGWSCRSYSGDINRLFPMNCYMGRIKVLKGLSFLNPNKLTREMKMIIDTEVEQILENQIWKYLKFPDGSRKEKKGWTKFGFPLFYNSDVLEVLDILTRLGIKDDRMSAAIELVISKQRKDGKWYMENSFNGKMNCTIEELHAPSKWITLRALRVLNRYQN